MSDTGTGSEIIAADTEHLDRIAAVAIAQYPNEACGVLIGRRVGKQTTVLRVTEARNIVTTRARDRFHLDPAGFLEADRWASQNGLDIVGFWHSHPDHPPVPSPTDLESAWSEYSYLIVSVTENCKTSHRSWRLDGNRFVEERIEQ